MILLTIAQAAERIGLQPRTIRGWITRGALPVVTHPVLPGIVLVNEDTLLATYRGMRSRGGPSKAGRLAS